MYSYGVGSLIDLPNMAVLVAGLDDWDLNYAIEITEERLLAAVRHQMAPTVERLMGAPWLEETQSIWDEWTRVGIPVLPFPRWMRCPRCGLLSASVGDSGHELFKLQTDPARPDRSRFVHTTCNRAQAPAVVPARFVVACTRGHIDEFPWIEFAHRKAHVCATPSLEVQDRGRGTRSTEVKVTCRSCGASAWVTSAFQSPETTMPVCRGREAHLRRFDPGGCDQQVRPLMLGASNAWFPLTLSALSIPRSSDPLTELVRSLLGQLEAVVSRDDLEPALRFNPALTALKGFALDEVWTRVTTVRGAAPDEAQTGDLLRPEWDVLTDPAAAPAGKDFAVAADHVPAAFGSHLRQVVRAERLREVVALTGFTRIDSPDSGVDEDAQVHIRAPLTRTAPSWVPASEVRGEGIFLSLPEERLRAWEDQAGTADRPEQLRLAHARWRGRRGLSDEGWRGHRYTLLHSLAHLLINELSLECGYSAASIRERIYSCEGSDEEAMAGLLLYTAAPDSEGTLGGLVSLADPSTFGRLLGQALDRAQLCASDPLCADHIPDQTEDSLHLAACHACLFIPETSCERGNRYLDRAAVVPTLAEPDVAYFRDLP
jgi:hypothetical protein